MKFFDTTFLIDIIRKFPSAETILDRLDKEGSHATNTIVVHEFLVGAYGARNSNKELRVRRKLLQKLIILSFDLKAAEESAKIENDLRKEGKLIGGADILIAGTMIANKITTIITRNSEYFDRIQGINTITY
ncbi:MAG: type II toxin-antitoxin system VapC family toxin [Candidatus Lokiarchaeota archaeon]|nr:type II toxin-antitoxin system VapC family toxin [Candidatus Lokiarchaeota archaeon]